MIFFSFSGLYICLWSDRFRENLYNDGQAWTSRGKGLDTSFIRTNISNKAVSATSRLEI